MRTLLVTMLLAGAVSAHANETRHYINVVNTAPDDIIALAVAPAGTNRFHTKMLAGNLVQGGGDSTTISVDADGGGAACLFDLRFSFANGRTLIQKNFDVCKYRSYHTGRYLRGRSQTVVASVP